MFFSTHLPVRFGDIDPAGFVYYPNLLHYCHIAMEEFFAACCGIGYDRLIAHERLGFPTVDVRAEFFAPLVYGDVAEVDVFVSRVGDSSVTFEYRLRRSCDRTLCATVSLVAVAMNLDERRAVTIPEKYRQAFARNAE